MCTTTRPTSTRWCGAWSAPNRCSGNDCRGLRTVLRSVPNPIHELFMLRHWRLLAAAALVAPPLLAQSVPATPTVAQFLSPASPLTLTAAKKADRLAWMAYEKGGRNVYVASAPTFKPVKLTSWTKDDAIDLTNVSISDDGQTVIFIRGHGANRDGWIASPDHDPEGGQRAV